MHTEVLIVGAGPTGLVLAIELARRGVPHRLVEKATLRSPESRGLGLQPRTLELLAQLGVARQCLRESIPLKATRIFSQEREPRRISFEFEVNPWVPYPEVRILPQRALVEVLTGRLEDLGGRVERSHAFASLRVDSDRVEVVLSRPDGDLENVSSRFLVGCDGAYSLVRDAAGIAFPGETLERIYTIGEVEIEWDLPHGESYQFLGDTRFLLAIPLPERGRYRLTTWEDAPRVRYPDVVEHGPVVAPPTLQILQSYVDEVVPFPAKLTRPEQMQSYRVGRRLAERFREGPVFLAGDAAHILPPVGAQGMNLGIGDAVNLAWKLAAGGPEELLESYHQERRPVAEHVLEQTDRALLDLAASILEDRGWPNLERHLLARRWSQLDVSYRSSPLSRNLEEGLPEMALHAGDRAPDASLIEAGTGRSVRLFNLFREPCYHLLAFDAGPLDPLPGVKIHCIPEDLVDAAGEVALVYRPSPGSLILVRPDGYLALRAPAGRLDLVKEYLAATAAV